MNARFPQVNGQSRRKLLAAREDVAARIGEIASRRGLTLYGLVNEALASVITMEDAGITLNGMAERSRTLDSAKNAGFLLCAEALWYETVEQAYRNSPQGMAKLWFEAGARCAKLFMIRENERSVAAFARDITAFTWNAPDFSFDVRDREVRVRCLSPKFSKSYALLFSRFLEGAFDAFGYDCASEEVDTGALQLRLSRKKSNAEAH